MLFVLSTVFKLSNLIFARKLKERTLKKSIFISASLALLIAAVYSLNYVYADPKIKDGNNDPFAVSGQGPNHNVPGGNDQDDSETIPNDANNVIMGTNGDDFIRGTPQDDIIYGLKGDDQIYAFDGKDKIVGGKGNDIIDGGPGSDTLYGNSGNDFLAGNTGSDSLIGGAGDDILRGRNALVSEAEPDSFECGKGTDTIDDFNANEGDTKTPDCE